MVYFDCGTERSTKLMLSIVGAVTGAVAAFLGMVTLDLSVAGASADESRTQALSGTVVVPFGVSSEPVSCHLSVDQALAVLGGEATEPCPSGPLGGYGDVADGARIRVLDGAGAELASTRLTGGVAEGGTVTFGFEVEGVPVSDTYQFQVNTRGAERFSLDRLARDGWNARIDLR
jgi:hypothetical protein